MPLPVETRLERLLARRDVEAENCPLMGEYWHRPGEFLVHRDDLDSRDGFRGIGRALARWGAEPCDLPEKLRNLRECDFPVQRWTLPPRMSVDAVVTLLRQVPAGPEPRVGPNHLFGGLQSYGFLPSDLPIPDSGSLPLPAEAPVGFIVAVIDSGLVQDGKAAQFVTDAGARLVAPASENDPVDVDPPNGMLDDADAHGTFIAGIVLREAPSATVRMTAVLDDSGLADELEIADAIVANGDAQVINLSLGGYTKQDVAPVSIVEAINALPPEVVVVAAAGNYSKRRPLFPAALKRVIAVAAVDDTVAPVNGMAPMAGFSNFGWWVDACASGQSVLSNFVVFTESDGTVFAGGFARWSGTSFAAPRVAGVIAARTIAAQAVDPSRSAREVAFELLHGPGSAARWRSDLGTLV